MALELYLQFDSLREAPLRSLRGADLCDVHERALATLNELNIPTALVATVRRGLNDDELGDLVEFAASQRCVRGITFQPVQAAGRLENYADGNRVIPFDTYNLLYRDGLEATRLGPLRAERDPPGPMGPLHAGQPGC